MGNTQSAEAPRRPATKLTKPRTNTSTLNLLATASAPSRRTSKLDLLATASLQSRQNSPLDLLAVPNKRSSTVSVEDVIEGDDVPLKFKAGFRPQRLSLFRSRPAQVEIPVQVETPVWIEEQPCDHDNKIPSDPLHRYTSHGSVKIEMRGDARYSISDTYVPETHI